MRDRLIELLNEADNKFGCFNAFCTERATEEAKNELIDYLLNNSVVCPPCKVGDKLYIFYFSSGQIEELEVASITFRMFYDVIEFTNNGSLTIWDKDYNALFGKTVFLTKEEAENALKGGVQE